METHNNGIHMNKVVDAITAHTKDEHVSSAGIHTPRTNNPHLINKMKNLSHKKNILIICFILIIIAIILFFFKDLIFRNKAKEDIAPKNYQEVIDQSFKEGYKTNYTYDPKKVEQAISDTKPVGNKVKSKSLTPAERKAFEQRINN